MTALYIALSAIFALFLIYLFLVFPSARDAKKAGFFCKNRVFAHRGLFSGSSAPENSPEAFRRALVAGLGCELDVHLTSDGELVVIHDSDTLRVCGVSLNVEKSTFSELSSIALANGESIPLFSQVLSIIDGKVPLIVEIKGENFDLSVCEKTASLLDSYSGEYCIESFNPVYVRWWKLHRPDVIRGQLACRMKKTGGFVRRIRDFALENLLLDFLSRPDFVAYDIEGASCLSFRLAKALGAVPVAWTVRTDSDFSLALKHRFVTFICESEGIAKAKGTQDTRLS